MNHCSLSKNKISQTKQSLTKLALAIQLFCLTDGAGGNKQHSASKDSAKLDRETEELHRKSCTVHASTYIFSK